VRDKTAVPFIFMVAKHIDTQKEAFTNLPADVCTCQQQLNSFSIQF